MNHLNTRIKAMQYMSRGDAVFWYQFRFSPAESMRWFWVWAWHQLLRYFFKTGSRSTDQEVPHFSRTGNYHIHKSSQLHCTLNQSFIIWFISECLWCILASNFLRTVHVVPRCRSPNPCLPQQQDTICCKNFSFTLLKMGKRLPETCWADLGDQ